MQTFTARRMASQTGSELSTYRTPTRIRDLEPEYEISKGASHLYEKGVSLRSGVSATFMMVGSVSAVTAAAGELAFKGSAKMAAEDMSTNAAKRCQR
mmetsp:Transcript_55713/g.166945  ORF Transcript_55713/g.166945 Transcript_55713/m.166945 type:complete len:97 (-) Transcript_55713:1071-1361(-)